MLSGKRRLLALMPRFGMETVQVFAKNETIAHWSGS